MAEYVLGNLFIRDMGTATDPHEPGWEMQGHTHNFDHVTQVISGRYSFTQARPIINNAGQSVMLEDGSPALHIVQEGEMRAGDKMLIPAGMWHAFRCLEGPGRIECLYSHREAQSGEVIQTYNGFYRAYV